ncbi:hypothetical protein ES703_106477 [subsurface metagenome]
MVFSRFSLMSMSMMVLPQRLSLTQMLMIRSMENMALPAPTIVILGIVALELCLSNKKIAKKIASFRNHEK